MQVVYHSLTHHGPVLLALGQYSGQVAAICLYPSFYARCPILHHLVLRHGRDVHPAWVNVVTAALATKVVWGSGDES
jgi:hypothetical protein